MSDLQNTGLPARGVAAVPADVKVQVVDILPVGGSRQSQLETAQRQLAEQKRTIPIIQLENNDEEVRFSKSADLSRYTVRDSQGTMRYLIFHDTQPVIHLGANLIIRQGCEIHRDVLVPKSTDVNVIFGGTELTLEQRIWRLEKI